MCEVLAGQFVFVIIYLPSLHQYSSNWYGQGEWGAGGGGRAGDSAWDRSKSQSQPTSPPRPELWETDYKEHTCCACWPFGKTKCYGFSLKAVLILNSFLTHSSLIWGRENWLSTKYFTHVDSAEKCWAQYYEPLIECEALNTVKYCKMLSNNVKCYRILQDIVGILNAPGYHQQHT